MMNQIATSPQPTRAPEAVYTPPKRVDVEKMCAGYLLRHISATFNIDIPPEVRFIVLSYVQMNNNVWVTAIRARSDKECEDGVYSEGDTVTVCDGHGGKACMEFMLKQKFNFAGLKEER
jgi:hypothetical protein